MVKKAVVLARGLGKRMRAQEEWDSNGSSLPPETRAIADRGIKAMVPIAGRPFLDYSVQLLVQAGFAEICLVIGPHQEHQLIRDYCEQRLQPRLPADTRIVFACQDEPLGTAHAVLSAREVVGEEEFVAINGDNLYPLSALRALRVAPPGSCYTVAYHREALLQKSNFEPQRVAHFAVVEIDPDTHRMCRIVEKPTNPEQYRHNGVIWVSMNNFRFTPLIFDACQAIAPSSRGEYELPDAVQYLIDREVPIQVLFSQEGVLDLTRRDDIRLVEERLRDWTWVF